MSSKIGYFVMNRMMYGRGWSQDETTRFFDHIQALQPTTLLFLDDDGKALQAKALLPDCAVVVRAYLPNGEGELYKQMTPQQVFDLYKDSDKRLIRCIGNEPNSYVSDDDLRAMASWYAQVMDTFGNAGIAIGVPSFGEGHPDLDRISLLDNLWKAFDKWHNLHYYLTHEYGSWRGMLFNEGGKWDVTPWRIGRFETFVKAYLDKYGHITPKVIVTEFGCDSAHDGTQNRGWRSSWTEQRYADEIKAVVERFYHLPHYVGLCIYCYGNTGQAFTENDWSTFDVSTARDLQNALVNMSTPPITPPPFDYGTMTWAQLQITGTDYINLRSSPSTTGDILKQLHDGDEIKISENSLESGDYSWYKVVSAEIAGFVADTSKWRVTPIPDHTPPPQLATVIVRIKGLTVEAVKELVNNVEITIE